MLAVSSDAAEVIRRLMKTGIAGIRISTGPSTSNGKGPALVLDIAQEPPLEDEVIDAQGAQVFVDPAAALTLDDKVLDAHFDGDQVQFDVHDRD
jgi:Fe-S cluster assembly iron-binding protein IscA